MTADETVEALAARGITTCALYEENALFAFRRMKRPDLVRVSLHYFNTDDDIRFLGDATAAIATG